MRRLHGLNSGLANTRQTMATASLRQEKTLAQDPGFIWLGTPESIAFPALTSWTHPEGASDAAWIQLFGPDATPWMLQQIDLGLAILGNGQVAPPVMVVPTQEVVGGEPGADTQTITTTADLEPSAPTTQVVTATRLVGSTTPTPTRVRTISPPEPATTPIKAGIGAGAMALLAIGALFLFGRGR